MKRDNNSFGQMLIATRLGCLAIISAAMWACENNEVTITSLAVKPAHKIVTGLDNKNNGEMKPDSLIDSTGILTLRPPVYIDGKNNTAVSYPKPNINDSTTTQAVPSTKPKRGLNTRID